MSELTRRRMTVACADMRTLQRPQVVHAVAVTSAIECVLPTLVFEAISVTVTAQQRPHRTRRTILKQGKALK